MKSLMPLRYSTEVTVARSRDDVIAIIQDPAQAPHWMEGFVSAEPIEGEPWATGSKSRLTFKMGKRDMEMVETILTNNLPDGYHVEYTTDGVRNEIENRLIAVSDTETRWEMDNVFEFGGFMMKLMGGLMPFMFKKQTATYAQNFKAYAEDGTSVAKSG